MLTKIIKFIIKHPIMVALIVLLPIFLIIFAIVLIVSIIGAVSDNNQCQSSGGGTISANFSITNVLSNSSNKSKQIEEWCASKGMNAAQTAGVLGNSMAESTLGTATSNLMGMGANGSEAASDTAKNKGDSVSQYMNTFITHFSAPNCRHYIKDMKNSSPYECGYWWGAKIEVDGAGNNAERGHFAQEFYKKIAHGSSTVTDADDTAGSSSGSSCNGGGSDSATTDIVQYAESQIGKHHYTEAGGTGHNTRNGMLHYPDSGWADCSSFCYFVLRHCQYKVPSFGGNAWTSPSTCKKISASDTKPGDIAWNSDHMVILRGHASTGRFYRGNNAKIVEEGGGTESHPNEDNVNNSTIGMAENESVEFFRPVKN